MGGVHVAARRVVQMRQVGIHATAAAVGTGEGVELEIAGRTQAAVTDDARPTRVALRGGVADFEVKV